MMFNEKDINFNDLNWKRFEELCFDLLVKYQFHSLKWRLGGPDKGRDIEALTTNSCFVEKFDEKWFIECKYYEKGIPVNVISEKIDWARAEKSNHFLLITNSYLSQTTRDWIDKIKDDVPFRIHIIEGKILKQRLLQFPDLINNYFSNDREQLIKGLIKQWVNFDILPDAKALYKLYHHLNLRLLDVQELGFLWFCYKQAAFDLEDYCDRERLEQIDPDFLVPWLRTSINSKYPILAPKILQHPSAPLGTAIFRPINIEYIYASVHEPFKEGNRVQVVLEAENKNLNVYIAAEGIDFPQTA